MLLHIVGYNVTKLNIYSYIPSLFCSTRRLVPWTEHAHRNEGRPTHPGPNQSDVQRYEGGEGDEAAGHCHDQTQVRGQTLHGGGGDATHSATG